MVERPAGPATVLARAQALALPIVGGLLLIMYAALALVYWQQRTQQAPIEGQLAQLSRVLNQPREGLEGLKAQVEEARGLIPQGLMETEVYPIIRALAAQNRVLVSSQAVGKGTQDKIGDTVYEVMSFSIRVGGEGVTYQQVVDFIANLETQQSLPTLSIRKVSIAQSESTANANIEFKVYVKPAPTPKPGQQR